MCSVVNHQCDAQSQGVKMKAARVTSIPPPTLRFLKMNIILATFNFYILALC